MKNLSPRELKSRLAAHEPLLLVDVREPFEHDAFNIGGELIPLGDVVAQAARIPFDKPVVLYCQKGIRSQIAIQRLEEKFGYQNLYNLTGGMADWQP